MTSLRIRPLTTFDELEAGVELQKATWGRHFDDIVSAALMRVVQKIGGIAAGAFDADEYLVGVVFGLTGVRDDTRVHWSHMLAVEPGWRGRGLGTVLKVYQRRRVLSLGIDQMYWTFDPLEARNAHFNLNRLGVRIDGYVDDMYGSGDTSELHRGIGTDRFIAVWPLGDSRLNEKLDPIENTFRWDESGMEVAVDDSNLTTTRALGLREDDSERLLADALDRGVDIDNSPAGRVFIEIPPDIQQLKAGAPEEASTWRTATRTAFTHYLSRGMRVTGFIRDPESGRCFYVLEPPSPA